MKKIDFNKGWTCRCLTRNEKEYSVSLPHDAMLSEPRAEESRGGGNIGWFIGGSYEYTKQFKVSQTDINKKMVLEFEGVYRNAEIFINGMKAAYRPYGYTNFYVDTEGYLKYGEENEIRVTAHNDDQPNSRWYTGTGIYRPVWLYIGEENYIPVNGVRIRTISINPARIEVRTATSRDGEVFISIADEENEISSIWAKSADGEAVAEIEIPDAKLWSCDTPYLYTCEVRFGNDCVKESFGIRKLEWGSQSGLTINGERIILRGACVHHDNGVLGACAYKEAEERKVWLLKENGYNALRSAHNPCSKAMLEACDRLGMLIMDEYVDVWYIHKTEYDYANYMKEWWHQDLKDMVEKDYNHPSVIMYSTGNEVAETAQKKGIDLTRQMTGYLHKLDDTRPVTCGINIFFNFLSSIGLGVYSDDKAKKDAESAGGNGKKKKPVGSEFYNSLACLLGDYTMKIGATLYPCDLKTRDAFANMDIAGYNYGIFRYKHDLKKYPNRLIVGSETFCKDAYSFWETAKQNPRIIGDFVWSGMGYIGEAGNGAVEYSDYKLAGESTQISGGNGRIDLMGKPGAEAAYTRVAFEEAQGPFIAVTPVYEREKLNLTGWQLTRAVESWSWRGCAGMPAVIEVYARAYEVELFINGTSIGRKKMKRNCRIIFKSTYQDGEITAVSYDQQGREIGRKILKTAEEKVKLHCELEKKAMKPGGLGFIWLRYEDEQGIWTPMEKHRLNVQVEHGELLGLGSASPYTDNNFTDHTVQTYFGEALAVVRSDETNTVRMIVSDENGKYAFEISGE